MDFAMLVCVSACLNAWWPGWPLSPSDSASIFIGCIGSYSGDSGMTWNRNWGLRSFGHQGIGEHYLLSLTDLSGYRGQIPWVSYARSFLRSRVRLCLCSSGSSVKGSAPVSSAICVNSEMCSTIRVGRWGHIWRCWWTILTGTEVLKKRERKC